ncbi:conserved exported protein of unknown function [Pseudodesulfovibrio profundus]|uniref:Solute-binding protein family 3/N-terminal domain-containing protein n=2 Tax=Pseudodesulfovibrio profundus TaxID=57320 RepID=A0A2C8FEQ2_9BACT|nr:conserved exported protein of unknown function [Pseudodesulfovibrio profundus]
MVTHICRYLMVFFLFQCALVNGTARAGEFKAYVGEIPPLIYLNDAGLARGAVVDVVVEAMEMAGIPLDQDSDIASISWARAIEDVEYTPRTMIFCMARTEQREDRFKWVGPVAEMNVGLVAMKHSSVSISDKDDVRKYRIGVIRSSGPVDILESEYGVLKENLTQVASDELQFRMLKAGRVDLITQADIAAPVLIREMGMPSGAYEMVHVLQHLYLYVAFNKQTDDELLEKVREAIGELRSSEDGAPSRYDLLLRKHAPEEPLPYRAK